MADSVLVASLRTAISPQPSTPLLIRQPRMVGFHKVTGFYGASIITTGIYPDTSTASDNWFCLKVEPVLPAGEAAGSLIGRPSTALPDLSGVLTCAQLMGYLEATYNTYKVALADGLGTYLCEAPLRTALTTEYGTTNRVATVLQLF